MNAVPMYTRVIFKVLRVHTVFFFGLHLFFGMQLEHSSVTIRLCVITGARLQRPFRRRRKESTKIASG